jgi:hypothetical protein
MSIKSPCMKWFLAFNLVVPGAVAATDGIVTIASRIAHQIAASYDLQILSPPIEVGNFQVAMAWR